MDMNTIAMIASMAFGTGGVGAWVFNLVKSRSEAGKTKIEGQVILVDSAAQFANAVRMRLEEVQARLDRMEAKEDVRDRLAIAHSRWDYDVMHHLRSAGIEVGEPPPLLPDTH